MLNRYKVNTHSWITHFYTADHISNVSADIRVLLSGLLARSIIITHTVCNPSWAYGVSNYASDKAEREMDSIRDMLLRILPDE